MERRPFSFDDSPHSDGVHGFRFRTRPNELRCAHDHVLGDRQAKLKPRWDVHLSGDDDQLG